MLVSIFQFFVGFLILKNYKQVAWHIIPPMMIGMIIGVAIGVHSLAFFDLRTLRYILSLYILLYLTKSYFFPSLSASRESYLGGVTAGLFGGFFQGSLSTGGPNLVIYLKKLIPDSKSFRATMIFWLSVANIARIPFSYRQNLYTNEIIHLTKFIFPLFILATALGQIYHHKISNRLYFQIVHIFLLFAAIALIIKNVYQG